MPQVDEDDIEKLVSQLSELEDEIETGRSYSQQSIQHIKGDINDLSEMRGILEENAYNLDQSKEEVDDLVSRLKEFNNRLASLENVIQQVEERNKMMDELSQEVHNVRDALGSLVEDRLDTKIVSEFQHRRSELGRNLKWWKLWTFLSVFALFVSSGYMYFDISGGESVGSVAVSKILLLLPVLVAVWISVGQYRQQKRLIEKYEFKTSMADSLMGFREILKQDFPEGEQDRVGEFVIGSVNRMYQDPYEGGSESSETEEDGQVPISNLGAAAKIFK